MSSLTKTLCHSSDTPIPFPDIRRIIGPCLLDTEYPSLLTLLAAYESHSYSEGYSVVLADSLRMKRPNKLSKRVIYRCDCWGKLQIRKKKDVHESRKRANTGSKKCNCPFLIEAQELPSGQWRGSTKIEHYNHDPSNEVTSYPSHRKRALESNEDATALIQRLLNRRTPAATIKLKLKAMGVRVRQQDLYNIRLRIRST
jgi:hypothetical protein